MPSELKSRPKIPRTPAEGEGRERFNYDLNERQDIPQADEEIIPKIKGEEVKDAEKIDEFKQGFLSKQERIPRTPPEEIAQRRKLASLQSQGTGGASPGHMPKMRRPQNAVQSSIVGSVRSSMQH